MAIARVLRAMLPFAISLARNAAAQTSEDEREKPLSEMLRHAVSQDIQQSARTPWLPTKAAENGSSCLARRLLQRADMFLIDGNNVLGNARHTLVDGLARLAHSYATSSVVIFDGVPDSGPPSGSAHPGVKVYYSGCHATAHERIVEFVEREVYRSPVTVVTSDTILANRARARGARVVPSDLLRRALVHGAYSPPRCVPPLHPAAPTRRLGCTKRTLP